MDKRYLILGIHNHQPIGNFDFVFERCCQKAYLPFLKVLKAHPQIKINLHYSGILWDWLFKQSSPILTLLTDMIASGQIELLGGGYYEPILSILPDRDKIGQVRKLNEFLFRHFQVKIRGMWLTERVWEPHLVKYIWETGIEYLAVDDLHFRSAGLQEEDLHGYYLTEEQGNLLRIFPGSKYLRYSIPFKSPEENIDFLLTQKTGKGNLTLMADDGEKFGVWPGTYDLSYQNGWLDRFFSLLEEHSEQIEIITFSDYIKKFPPLGNIYLPTASYAEMEEWSLPTESINEYLVLKNLVNSAQEFSQREKPFIKGGYWRNFLCKYTESNHIYRKMLWVSSQLEKYFQSLSPTSDSPEWLEEAQNELWKGQCNDAYWHGLFGGLYLPHLRQGIYTHLIQAENILDYHSHSTHDWIDCFQTDIDGDGYEEIIIKTRLLTLCVDCDSGGVINELDYRPKFFNIINSLMRREEHYHHQLREEIAAQPEANKSEVKSIHDIRVSKEKDLSTFLFYDQYPRNCLIDHFLPCSTDLRTFSQSQHQEYGDFIRQKYNSHLHTGEKETTITLERNGSLCIEGKVIPFLVKKVVKVSSSSSALELQYSLINRGEETIRCLFGVEFNINLLGGRCENRYYRIPHISLKDRHLASQGQTSKVKQIQLIDEDSGFLVSFDFTSQPIIWRFPIETASNSESGFEKVFQSSVIFPHWELALDPGDEWKDGFQLKILDLEKEKN